MYLFRAAVAAGLLIIGLDILIVAAATEAVAAGECPCIQTGNSCIPDLACEAREREQGRARTLRELEELRRRESDPLRRLESPRYDAQEVQPRSSAPTIRPLPPP